MFPESPLYKLLTFQYKHQLMIIIILMRSHLHVAWFEASAVVHWLLCCCHLLLLLLMMFYLLRIPSIMATIIILKQNKNIYNLSIISLVDLTSLIDNLLISTYMILSYTLFISNLNGFCSYNLRIAQRRTFKSSKIYFVFCEEQRDLSRPG